MLSDTANQSSPRFPPLASFLLSLFPSGLEFPNSDPVAGRFKKNEAWSWASDCALLLRRFVGQFHLGLSSSIIQELERTNSSSVICGTLRLTTQLMGWGNIYKRRLKVFTLAMLVYLDYKAVQKREKWAKKEKSSVMWEKTHERNAKRILNLILELEGLWVKLGQYLSTRADVLPHAYIVVLRQLQDSLPPRPLLEVQHTIERELGQSVNDLFSNFVETPLATASIAQVHRATLKTGQEVVAKVQHDGIKEIILEDLKNAKSIIDWIAWAEPQYDFNPVIDEWCKEAPNELDFNHEAENTRTVSKNLGCRNTQAGVITGANHVDVLIPEVIQSSERVLILEYMNGIRLNDLESLNASGIDKQKLSEEITRAYSHQIYVDGFFNGDPHPGNFLVSRSPPHQPILLDFGLTKSLSSSIKQAFAKVFLAAAEGDHVALLSAFTEMGLKLRLDIPDQAMDVMNAIFRSSSPANEAMENMKAFAEQKAKNMKVIQEKMNMDKKEIARFNPVDAFPGDAVIFFRVLNLLRGLSSTLNVRIVYLDIMRPFAESTLKESIIPRSLTDGQWVHDSQIHSVVETKLRQLLVELGTDRVLGIQVCAYKDGNVIVDTSAGVLGRYDPRPVLPDCLFPVFSVTKGITAAMLHWLVDNRKLKLEENVANIWSDFKNNKKDLIKVHHVLNHTSGLHSAMNDVMKTNPLSICNWDESLNHIAMSVPETEPGHKQLYHYLSFGWLCGGIIEHASGKKFQEVLEDAIVRPLKIEGELYIGIPPGVESRLATLTVDVEDLTSKLSAYNTRPDMPADNLVEMASGISILFNTLNMRRAVVPAANGHCSARALARFYAALATGGVPPPKHSSNTKPSLGSHPHIPTFPSLQSRKKKGSNRGSKEVSHKAQNANVNYSLKKFRSCASGTDRSLSTNSGESHIANGMDNQNESENVGKMFSNPDIHDAFMGVGDYANLVLPDGKFGLGYRRFNTTDGRVACFGHSGVGGSTGFCDIEHNFAIAVTVNKMSFGGVTRRIVQLICSELNIPIPLEFTEVGERGPDMQINLS